VTENRAAGLVVSLSALAVVSFLAVREGIRAVPVRDAVEAAPTEQVPPAVQPPAVRAPVRRLAFPVQGFDRLRLRDNFDEARGSRRHEALDIMAPRGTPVVAVDDGRVAKLYRGAAGGLTVYQYDAAERHVFFYAHLDRYAAGLAEGDRLGRGQVIGYVGSTGNAPKHAPHLHFAMFELGPDRRWWKGRAINPYELLR
jgi:murein DD-endopeptidase MepM/ murein hydrolase activator NlpD